MSIKVGRRAGARAIASLALGWGTSWLILNGGFALLRAAWPAYALADPEKAYTLTMLFVRLFIFSTMIAATSGVAVLIAGDKRFAWIVGGVILAASIPSHLYPGYVWNDYPAWYHIVYLLSIVPIAAIAGTRLFRPHRADRHDEGRLAPCGTPPSRDG